MTYLYIDILNDARKAIDIAKALDNERVRLLAELETVTASNDRLHRDLLGAEERLIDTKAELDRVVAANHHYQADNDSLRSALAHYTDRMDNWARYATAWEHWADGNQIHRPTREQYGL